MNRKRIISLLLVVGLVTSCLQTLTYADVEQDVINAQAQYEEYQKSVDEMTAEVVKFNSEIEQCISNIDSAEYELSSLNSEIENNEARIITLENEIKEREEIQGIRLREYHKSGGNINYFTLIFQAEDFSDLMNKVYLTTKLMKMDRDIVASITANKKELDDIISKQEENRKSVKKLLDDLEADRISLEKKKLEQEELLNSLKDEQQKFSVEVLEVAEIALLSAQEEIINTDNSSLTDLRSCVTQLQAIRDNQLTMQGSIDKANSLIDVAHNKIAYLEEQERLEEERRAAELAQQMANNQSASPNRGDVIYKPSGGNVTGQDIVNYAYQFLGLPYVWGAVGPDTFDCSGFTSYVYRHCAGIEITRTTYTQINVGTPVSYNEMQPGDLVFTYDNEHVGIYVGGGMYINATYPGSTIRVTPVTNFYAARRIL